MFFSWIDDPRTILLTWIDNPRNIVDRFDGSTAQRFNGLRGQMIHRILLIMWIDDPWTILFTWIDNPRNIVDYVDRRSTEYC